MLYPSNISAGSGRSCEANKPRATLILRSGPDGGSSELWMGGADSAIGDVVREEDLRGAYLIDCAAEMPARFREAAIRWLPCVFPDMEGMPACYPRLQSLAAELAPLFSGERRRGTPHRVYVMCQQGLNRSGLVTGLILRAAGMDAGAVLALLRHRRPGSLANLAYAELLR